MYASKLGATRKPAYELLTGLTPSIGVAQRGLVATAIAIPPLAEQHRIVAKVDELMTLCDELAAAQNEREVRRDQLVVASLNRIGRACQKFCV